MITLRTCAIDGGVSLTLGQSGGGLELRLGWKAAMRLARDLTSAATIDPPWTQEGSDARWANEMLEISEQGIRVSKGTGRETVNQGFLGVLGAGLDVGAILDAPAAVFATDDEAHNRFLAPYPSLDFGDRSRVAIERAMELPDGGKDGTVGGSAKVLVTAAAIIGEHDEEAVVAGHSEPPERDHGEALVGAAARSAPLNADVGGSEARQTYRDQQIRSCVLQPGVDAESGMSGRTSPARPGAAQ